MRMGEEIHPKGYKRQVEATLPCETKLDTPFVSLVAWNTAGKLSSDSRFRRAMTMLLPRGAIMRAGAGGLGDLISAPILRNHPGYKKSQLVPPYEPLKAEAILNELGYRRSEQDGFRRDQSGNPVQMTIYVADYDGSTLLRKVLDDSFRALGFRIIFTPKKQDNVDGHLLVVRSPWPDGDLSSFLQDRDKEYGWTWTYSKTELDAAVSAYSRSLTFKKPDFRLLERVHEVLASQDFFSILMHHRICLDSIDRQGNKVALMPVNQRNPDWLVALLRKISPK
jgi:ABC-type transport system substrate-binding protein